MAGRHPGLYRALFRLSSSYRRENLVTADTDICIEGPPGSGNTFVVTAFSMANPSTRIAHHHHVRAQLHRARQLEVPTISLLRHPVDCALSRASSWETPDRSNVVLGQWVDFFADDSLIDYSLLVGFESIKSSLEPVVDELNRRYGTTFVSEVPEREAVFVEMDRRRAQRRGRASQNPNRPDERRAERPASWRSIIEASPRAQTAVRRYEELTRDAL